MKPERFLNLLILLIAAFVIFKQGSLYIKNQQRQGHPAPSIQIPLLEAKTFDLQSIDGPLIVIFWATWCGPCQIELARVNHMIESGEIKAESILAITSFEDSTLVEQTARDRHYLFPIGLDSNGTVAQSYDVTATPTIVFIAKDKSIDWITTGLSPLLGYRIVNFLKK
jgi:cytochrome c biogenesis protein CcmG/thiol:disulfide interchange protein DsbE